jgi:hypothetical protein
MSAITICKFYTNPVPSENDNALISRTLLKVSVIDRRWEPSCGQQPRDGEFWQVEVVREFGESMKGCFLLHPKARIHESDVRSLIPGTYDIEAEAGLIVITPHNPGIGFYPSPTENCSPTSTVGTPSSWTSRSSCRVARGSAERESSLVLTAFGVP